MSGGKRGPALIRPVMATALVAVLGPVLAACSGSATSAPPAMSPNQLKADMRTALRSATGVHVTGNISGPRGGVGLNLNVRRSGQLAGTVVNNGVPIQLVATGGRTYVKATPAFIAGLHLPAGVCRTICGKYLVIPPGKAAALTTTISLPALTGPLVSNRARFTGTRVTRSSLDGTPVYVLHTSGGGTIQVTQSAPHYPLAVISPGRRHGVLTFSDWNKVPAPRPPPRSQLVTTGSGRTRA